mgnify:CR=1 FL=1
MVVWFRWLSYAQPVSFAFEALVSNECAFSSSNTLRRALMGTPFASPHAQRSLRRPRPQRARLRRHQPRQSGLRDRRIRDRQSHRRRISLPPAKLWVHVREHMEELVSLL